MLAPSEAAPPPFPVVLELPGWDLFWTRLAAEPGDPSAAAQAAALRAAAARRAPAELGLENIESIAEHPAAAALRRLFRAAGCDPTRYRPSSEALLRRVLKGDALPAIHPLVDVNNCLSVALAVPSCVLAEGSFEGPVTLRAGREGEAFESLRGPFQLAGKPLLADASGPFGTPITDSQRVKVRDDTRRAWLVAYLPAGVVTPAEADSALAALLALAPSINKA